MIKAILFDLDGTLINTNNLIVKSFQYAFKKHLNLDMDYDNIVKHFGEPLMHTMAMYDAENPHQLISVFREYNEEMHDELVEGFEQVNETLNELKNLGIKLAVVTSKRKDMSYRGLKLFNIFDYMDVIVTPEDTEKHKPEGEPVLKALEMLKLKPEEAIMVGDSANDILCAQNAGCLSCLVKYTALPLEDMLKYKPDYAVDRLWELIDIVSGSEDIAQVSS